MRRRETKGLRGLEYFDTSVRTAGLTPLAYSSFKGNATTVSPALGKEFACLLQSRVANRHAWAECSSICDYRERTNERNERTDRHSASQPHDSLPYRRWNPRYNGRRVALSRKHSSPEYVFYLVVVFYHWTPPTSTLAARLMVFFLLFHPKRGRSSLLWGLPILR